MNNFLSVAKRFLKSEEGPTATEYAVMLSLIIVACILAVTALGTAVSTEFGKVETAITT
ncbi:MAG: Flp family type IVb pilin [Phycisphaerae bacterium]